MLKLRSILKILGITLTLLVLVLAVSAFSSQSQGSKAQIEALNRRVAALETRVNRLTNPVLVSTGALKVTSAKVANGNLEVTGTTTIDPGLSIYIQYYIGKEYPGTTSNCIYAAGINGDSSGHFSLELPVTKLKGSGTYKIAFEQNPRSNSILAPEHFMAFYKDSDGVIHFGDVSSMGELSNLAMTVGMEIVECEVTLP
jgi:hypothetical protein